MKTLIAVLRFVLTHPVSTRNKGAALIRFLRWQIGSRLLGKVVVQPWINGARFYVTRSETGLTGNIYNGLHEFPEMGFLLHFLRAEDHFVDIGANAGSYSVLAGKAIGAKVIAFEPLPATYHRLIENMRLNHLETSAQCRYLGLAAVPGRIRFTASSDTMNHVVSASEAEVAFVEVPVSTLDDELAGVVPALMKIDVEGFEWPVLQGGLRTLAEQGLRAVIMELNGSGNRYGHDESQILELMQRLGFKSCHYNPFSRVLTILEGKNQKGGNTIFVRDPDSVRACLKAAPAFVLFGESI